MKQAIQLKIPKRQIGKRFHCQLYCKTEGSAGLDLRRLLRHADSILRQVKQHCCRTGLSFYIQDSNFAATDIATLSGLGHKTTYCLGHNLARVFIDSDYQGELIWFLAGIVEIRHLLLSQGWSWFSTCFYCPVVQADLIFVTEFKSYRTMAKVALVTLALNSKKRSKKVRNILTLFFQALLLDFHFTILSLPTRKFTSSSLNL